MQRVARVDDVRPCVDMVVRQEPSAHRLHIGDSLRSDRLDHRRRRVHRENPCSEAGSSERERAGTGAEVDDHALLPETELSQKRDVRLGIECGFLLVPRDRRGLDVLRPGERELVGHPVVHVL
jgi:hypothetical protein